MRMTAAALLVLLLPLPAAAQEPAAAGNDDFDFGVRLAEEGWFDLSREVFSALPEADALFGNARLLLIEAQRMKGDAEKQRKTFEQALADLEAVAKKFPKSPRALEASGEIGYAYQMHGKALLELARRDATHLPAMMKAFETAISQFQTRWASLKGTEAPESKLDCGYNLVSCCFAYAESLRDFSGERDKLRAQLDAIFTFYEEFQWEGLETYYMFSDTTIVVARAYQLRGTVTGATGEGARDFEKAFSLFRVARGVLSSPEDAKNAYVLDLATRATYFEVLARIAFASAQTGSDAVKQYQNATQAADTLFKIAPAARTLDIGIAAQIEQGRAMSLSGDLTRGTALLEQLISKHINTPAKAWVIDQCYDILGSVGFQDAARAISAAENLFERGMLQKAAMLYRGALATLPPADVENAGRVWWGLAQSYFFQGRYFETERALQPFVENKQLHGSPDIADAVRMRKAALSKIIELTGGEWAKSTLSAFQQYVSRELPNVSGAEGIREGARTFEDEASSAAAAGNFSGALENYAKAIELWKTIKPDAPGHPEALFSIGFDHYVSVPVIDKALKAADLEREKEGLNRKRTESIAGAHEYLSKFLTLFRALPEKQRTPVLLRNAAGSVLMAMSLHLKANDATQALAVSEGFSREFPTADPINLMRIMRRRVDALLALERWDDADAQHRELAAKFKTTPLEPRNYETSLAAMYDGLSKASKKLAGSDAERSKKYENASLQYYLEYVQVGGGGKSEEDPESFAKLLLQQARAARTGNPAEAAKQFLKAAELFRELEGSASDDDKRRNFLLLRCESLIFGGEIAEAVKSLEAYLISNPGDGYATELLGDAQFETATRTSGPAQRAALEAAAKRYEDYYAKIQGTQDERFFRLVWKIARVRESISLEALAAWIVNFERRGIAPGWDGGEFGYKDRLEALRAKTGALPRKEGR